MADRDVVLGVVLAGGRSSRMGEPKALLPFGPDGQPLVDWVARSLEPLVGRVEVAAGGRAEVARALGGAYETFEDAACRAVAADEGRNVGPLGALAAALDRAEALGCSAALVVPCDMPLVTAAELSPLLEAVARGADAAFYRVEDRDQPLCAAYSVRCVRAAHAALERGQRRVVALLDGTGADGRGLRVQRLDPGEKSAGRLMNVNAPEDYDRARAIYPV